jgi:hypothetical protein
MSYSGCVVFLNTEPHDDRIFARDTNCQKVKDEMTEGFERSMQIVSG